MEFTIAKEANRNQKIQIYAYALYLFSSPYYPLQYLREFDRIMTDIVPTSMDEIAIYDLISLSHEECRIFDGERLFVFFCLVLRYHFI
jgi:hypothetical protein